MGLLFLLALTFVTGICIDESDCASCQTSSQGCSYCLVGDARFACLEQSVCATPVVECPQQNATTAPPVAPTRPAPSATPTILEGEWAIADPELGRLHLFMKGNALSAVLIALEVSLEDAAQLFRTGTPTRKRRHMNDTTPQQDLAVALFNLFYSAPRLFDYDAPTQSLTLFDTDCYGSFKPNSDAFVRARLAVPDDRANLTIAYDILDCRRTPTAFAPTGAGRLLVTAQRVADDDDADDGGGNGTTPTSTASPRACVGTDAAACSFPQGYCLFARCVCAVGFYGAQCQHVAAAAPPPPPAPPPAANDTTTTPECAGCLQSYLICVAFVEPERRCECAARRAHCEIVTPSCAAATRRAAIAACAALNCSATCGATARPSDGGGGAATARGGGGGDASADDARAAERMLLIIVVAFLLLLALLLAATCVVVRRRADERARNEPSLNLGTTTMTVVEPTWKATESVRRGATRGGARRTRQVARYTQFQDE